MIGDIELATIDQYKQCADVNLFGMIRMIKACLPFIRQSKGITLLLISPCIHRIKCIHTVPGIPWPLLQTEQEMVTLPGHLVLNPVS